MFLCKLSEFKISLHKNNIDFLFKFIFKIIFNLKWTMLVNINHINSYLILCLISSKRFKFLLLIIITLLLIHLLVINNKYTV